MPKQDSSNHKFIQLIGFLFFGVLFCISWIYYQERMLSFDPAFFAYQLTQFKTFFIAIGRWGSIFSQILPLSALVFHWPLPLFLKIYSVSFIINYYLLFLVLTLVLKNYRAGIVLMLALCLGFRLVFYYATAELYLGIALSVLLWAIIAPEKPYSSNRKLWSATWSSLPLIITISYCHQLTAFSILFPLFFEIIYNKRWKDIHILLPVFFTILWFFIRLKFLSSSEYEQSKMLTIDTVNSGMDNLFTSPAWKYFQIYFVQSMHPLYYTYIFCLILILLLKRWLLFIYSLLLPVGYLVLIILINQASFNKLFFENYYTVFGLFTGVMLLYIIYERFPKGLQYLLIIPLLCINLNGIFKAHNLQTERVNYLERLTEYGRHNAAKKYLLNLSNIPLNIVTVQGFLPFETLLYSSLPSKDSSVTFYWAENMNSLDTFLNRKNVFLGPDFSIDWFTTQNMYHRYFKLPPTGYEKVNTSQADTAFHESYFNNKNVFMKAMKEEVHSNNYEFVIAPIRIINQSGRVICSTPEGKNPVYITYHFYDQNGKLLNWENFNTTLEVDVKDAYTQGLLVYLPPMKGTYIVEADMKTEGLRYWNTTTRFKLIYQ